MIPFVFWRSLSAVPVMLLVAFIVFSMLHLAPGDPASVLVGDTATDADIERVRQSLGLDQPFPVQFATWLWHVLQGDLGISVFTKVPVLDAISQRFGPTLSLMGLTVIIAVAVAVPLGVAAAYRAGGWIDRLVVASAVFGASIPVFVIGYGLAYVFSVKLGWFPVQGYTPLATNPWKWFNGLMLPATALACAFISSIARMTRATMIEVLAQDFVRTARAKGLPDRRVLFVHALRNAAVPIVTVIGQGVVLLIGGAVVTETVFSIPGVGRLTADAIFQRDYPTIQGVVLLFSFVYVAVNLVIDVIYALLDPRIRQ